jgi:hypothetical protein
MVENARMAGSRCKTCERLAVFCDCTPDVDGLPNHLTGKEFADQMFLRSFARSRFKGGKEYRELLDQFEEWKAWAKEFDREEYLELSRIPWKVAKSQKGQVIVIREKPPWFSSFKSRIIFLMVLIAITTCLLWWCLGR